MFRKVPHVEEAPRLEDLRFTDVSVPSRSCCCPARPVVKVIMPPEAGRAQPVDLWLCGHHYRASAAGLYAAGASVEDLRVTAYSPQTDHAVAPA
jgi:hypothetical protein